MKKLMLLAIAWVGFADARAETFLVENGEPAAEIVIAENPSRMVRVAAQEFQDQIRKISGARLPIVTKPTGTATKVFIGASPSSPVNADGLADGAYRIKTGTDWMALIGDDADFTPVEPFARNNSDIPRAQAEWEKIVGAPYGLPNAGLYKNRLRLPGETGKPEGAATAKNETLEIWGLDERGSFNAVCGYLRKLGARWYLPGELGEVLPSMKTIALAAIDETVRPDFALRQFNFRFSTAGPETSKWAMRLGIRNDERLQIAHGLANMTGRREIFAAHPEWFALYGTNRDFDPRSSKNQLCYSDEALFRETVRYARQMIDTFHFDSVSIMPPDGYTAICQCEKCRGKDSPERNERGELSDYVWDFVNRVAREVAKTHPKAKVLNCAYGVYTLPPEKIEKLEPNVWVCIVGGRRPINKAGGKGEGESAPAALRAAWAKKTDNPLIIFENYPFTDRGWYLPSFSAHALGESINATKGVSMGEDIWLSARQDFDKVGIGFNHFMVYFTARMYWGGKKADVDALFREYCRLFYGPAEKEMHAFFTYGEANWDVMEEEKEKADRALELFASAQAKVDKDSVYGRRLALIDDYLQGLRRKSEQLGQKRGPVPFVRLVGDARDIVVDGRLDDEYWRNCPVAATGRLRELQTGRAPTFGTSFKAGWQGNNLYFAIRCDERPGEKLNVTSTRHGDRAMWEGDAIEIEIATEAHSYYQIAISPAGHVTCIDRGAARSQWFSWDAKAEVATQVADDHWTLEVRLPVTQDENDPLHQIVGHKPTQSLPWHLNICRQRLREDGRELSALSPTGTDGFHEPMKFAHFFDGRSHRFEADPSVTDFALGFQNALKERKAAAFLALDQGKITDEQKSALLEQAAALDPAAAEALIERIPLDAVKKSARMQWLLRKGQAKELVAQFGEEDFAKWPFWKRGDAHFLRGRAYQSLKEGGPSEADFKAALEWISEPRARDALLLARAQNQEHNLKNDDAALASYRALVEGRARIGGADEYHALQGVARLLTKRGQFDEALATLRRVDVEKLQGVWGDSMRKAVDAVKDARKKNPGP